MSSERIISVVAALIRDGDGRVLLVRKRGTAAFMQPGGKRDVGESDVAALAREIGEELGCRIKDSSVQALGVFDCPAANEPGFQVQRRCLCGRMSKVRSSLPAEIDRGRHGSIRARFPTSHSRR